MKFSSGEALQEKKKLLAQKYPVGTRIELNSLCNDERDMPSGLRGTVTGMDDQPALFMKWDNGRSLSLLPDEDSFRKLTPDELAEEQSEALNEGMGGMQS
ncbi:MAG: DUF4314 domain-containing protein [Oscillospiraceae bacterium]|jgi:hypothetical protein|nr:DUF4314 domain-containing protein [Oscillospiraceae bacterium]